MASRRRTARPQLPLQPWAAVLFSYRAALGALIGPLWLLVIVLLADPDPNRTTDPGALWWLAIQVGGPLTVGAVAALVAIGLVRRPRRVGRGLVVAGGATIVAIDVPLALLPLGIPYWFLPLAFLPVVVLDLLIAAWCALVTVRR